MTISVRDLLSIGMVTYFLCASLNAQVRFQDKSLPCVEKKFNVQIVMSIDSSRRQPLLSPEQVQSILAQANYYFEPICMSLSSCDYKVIQDNYAYAYLLHDYRIREAGIVHALPRRINIFFSNEVAGAQCGYSEFYGFFTERNAHIYVELNCEDGPAEQIAHHLGHLLGLSTTNFTETPELVDRSNCHITGDSICDTPADPYGMTKDSTNQWVIVDQEKDTLPEYVDGCEFVWETRDPSGNPFFPHTTNIMSHYHCKCEFTREQYLKMVNNYYQSSIKQY